MVATVNPSSLRVSWQLPPEMHRNGIITRYVIEYTRVESGDITSETVTSGMTRTISGLVSFVDYSIRVAAINVNGTGPFSDALVQESGQDSKL